MPDPLADLIKAFHEDNAPLVRDLLARHPAYKARVNDPQMEFDAPPITMVRSVAMLDVLLEAGADINAQSRWWAGGFGLLHRAEPALAAAALARGAKVDVHAAARLGLLDKLRELVAADPALLHARGGDGQHPLHFASNVEIAEFLVQRGADNNARDIDHESTPAQYMVRERQEVARYLVRQGGASDVLLAAALGDCDLVRRHLTENPECIRVRVSDYHFPKINPRAGGTIYQWALGWHVSPHDVAKDFGHEHIYDLLINQSPLDTRLVVAGWSADEAALATLLREKPDLISALNDEDRRQVAHAARNNNTAAVRVMLAAGWPVDSVGQHRGTPLHWAAFHGNAEMAQHILRYHPPLEVRDADFQATPLGWAIHGSEHGWYCRTGNYPATVEALLRAGVHVAEGTRGGTAAVRAVLYR